MLHSRIKLARHVVKNKLGRYTISEAKKSARYDLWEARMQSRVRILRLLDKKLGVGETNKILRKLAISAKHKVTR
jgi:hypothetical protein